MADKNFQKELSALDRASIIKTTLWVIDQVESGSQNWRADYLKFYPKFVNLDPIELIKNVAGYKDTTQILAHAGEVRRRLREELDKLEAQEKAQSTEPGQVELGSAPPLPHNYYAVMAQLDTLLDQKKHQLALELTQTVVSANIPQSLGVAVTSADIEAIVDDATTNLITALPYTDPNKYAQAVSESVKNAILVYSKTEGAAYNLNLEQRLSQASTNFASRQKGNLVETAAVAHVATLATLIDPQSPAAPIISEEIKNTIDAYQKATNPQGDEVKKAQAPLEGYARGYINQFLIGIGPIVANQKSFSPKDIEREGKRAHEVVFRKFEEELKATYSPEQLVFFRQNFMQRALGLVRLQLGIASGKDIEKSIDLATPELASISFSAVAGLKIDSTPQKTLQDLLFKPPANLVPQNLQENLVAAYMQSEPLSTSDRENTVQGILGVAQKSFGEKATTLPLKTLTEGAAQIGRELKSQSQEQLEQELTSQQQFTEVQGIFRFTPSNLQIENAKRDAEKYLKIGKPVPYELQSIITLSKEPPRKTEGEERKETQKPNIRIRGLHKRYFKQKEILEYINKQPLQDQKSRSVASRFFRSISKPIRSLIPKPISSRFVRILGKVGGVLGRISAAIGGILILLGVAAVASKVLKRLGIALGAFYLWLMHFNLAVIVGALVGGTIGAIAGTIAGAAIGFQVGLAISAAFPFLGPFTPFVVVPITTAIGAAAGFIIGSGIGAAVGASLAAIFTGSFGTGAAVGAAVGGALGVFIPIPVLGPLIGMYGGALVGWTIETYLAPFFKAGGEAVGASAGATTSAITGAVSWAVSGLWGAIGNIFGAALSGVSGFLSGLGGLVFGIPGVGGLLSFFGIGAIVVGSLVIIATTLETPSGGSKNLILTKIAPVQVNNKSLVDYSLSVADRCASEVVVNEVFTSDAPLKSLQTPQIIDPQVESITSDPANLADIFKVPDSKYIGNVKWTIKLKGSSDTSCTAFSADPLDAQFLPPDNLYNPPNPNDTNASPNMDLIKLNMPIYQQAAAKTGIPWKMLAGFHWTEGGNQPDRSLSNGGCIGPGTDITGCGGGYTSAIEPMFCTGEKKEGMPQRYGSVCSWNSLLDSAIWAGKFVKEYKALMCDGKFENWKDAICAKGAYNGYQSRFNDYAPNGDFVKGLRNGYTTSYLEKVENWGNSSIPDSPFHRYGAYTVFVILATKQFGSTTIPPGYTAIGESVLLSVASTLESKIPLFDHCDELNGCAVVGRQVDKDIEALQAVASAGNLKGTIIFAGGNNGTFTTDQFNQIMKIASADRINRHVYFVTPQIINARRPDITYEKDNLDTIRNGVNAYKDKAFLIDWNAVSEGHNEYFSDGIHLTTAGQNAYANKIISDLGL